MAFSDIIELPSPTGARLALRHEPAVGEARGIVQINHGMAEHSARYEAFAGELSRGGYHVYAHDHRGHGLTTTPGTPAHVFDMAGNGHRLVLDDIAAVHEHIRGAHPGLPVFIFGHSMGGIVAMVYAFRHPGALAGAAAWNGNFTSGPVTRAGLALLAWERFRLGSDAPSRIMSRLTFQAWARSIEDRRTDFDWLSHDEAVVDAYIADPLCGWDASIGMWRDILLWVIEGAKPAKAPPEARGLPFHVVGGGQDPESEYGKSVTAQVKRMRRAGFADVTVQIYPQFRHETLNEIGRETAVNDLIAWLRSAES